MNVYVLRHGQTDYNLEGRFQGQSNSSINENGVKQVKKIKQELGDVAFDLVFSSPLKRAIQTTKIVTNLDIIIDNRLIERNFGKLEGKNSIDDYETRIEEFKIETKKKLKERVYDFLDEITKKYDEDKNILIVTHACITEVIDEYFYDKYLIERSEKILENGKYKKYHIGNKIMEIQNIEKIELAREDKLEKQRLEKSIEKKDKLKIVYLMVWTKVCGGSKIILEYTNRLSDLGHEVTIITYDKKPTWFLLNKNIKFVQLDSTQKIEDNIPNCDLVVATSWKLIYSAIKANCAPVAYFEQGGSHIFDVDNLDSRKRNIVQQRISEVPFIYTVSNDTKKTIKKIYKKDAFVVHNAVDPSIFYPRNKKINTKSTTITTIGPEEFGFKHVDNIIKAIKIIKQKHSNIKFNWISQTTPQKHKDMKATVNPKQKLIGDILRSTDIYICASDYESFGLPVLEAMTCGASVITTNNGGVSDFVKDEFNGLFIKKDDVQDIVKKVEILLEDKQYREKLAKNAQDTSKEFNWERSVKKLEKYYKELAQYKVI